MINYKNRIPPKLQNGIFFSTSKSPAPNYILLEFQNRRYEIFKSQNPDHSSFDVVFDIGGTKLYAHKSLISSISDTLATMLSDAWTTPNQPIVIQSYSYDVFKEFLTFIYSGGCSFTKENILQLLDASEFYNVDLLKQECKQYLSKLKIESGEALKFFSAANTYNLKTFKSILRSYIAENFQAVTSMVAFMDLEKDGVYDLIISIKDKVAQEDIFEAIYKWAEHRALDLRNIEVIKNSLSKIMPHFDFYSIDAKFLNNFIRLKTSLFSDAELDQILFDREERKVIVEVRDEEDNLFRGKFLDKWNLYDAINNAGNVAYLCEKGHIFWLTNRRQPSTPDRVAMKNNSYYLVLQKNAIALKWSSIVYNSDYILAEMHLCSPRFTHDINCKLTARL